MIDEPVGMSVSINGRCPHGCGETLAINPWSRSIVCLGDGCPDRHAAQRILDHDEPHHIVKIDENGWTIKHPLLERVDDKLFDCEVDKGLALFESPPQWAKTGFYTVQVSRDGAWTWTPWEGR